MLFVNISLLFQLHPLVTQRFYHLDHEKIKKEKYQYIDELVTTINEYNDILALWIKMKQGTLSLNIETFDLNKVNARSAFTITVVGSISNF